MGFSPPSPIQKPFIPQPITQSDGLKPTRPPHTCTCPGRRIIPLATSTTAAIATGDLPAILAANRAFHPAVYALARSAEALDVKTPTEMRAMIHSEIIKWDKLVKQADVKAD